jgi:hypothetical protein
MKEKIIVLILPVIFLFAACEKDGHESLPDSEPVQLPLNGTGADDGKYVFRFYTADGKLTRGYNEVFIALFNAAGNPVNDFSVENFRPLMDMGMNRHATPVGKVETVEGKPMYKTWFGFLMYSGQMDGVWTLDFDYAVAGETGVIAGVILPVDDYPSPSVKWISSFTDADETVRYLTLSAPRSFTEGTNVIRAYVNRRDNAPDPYPTEDDAWRIEIDPRMPSMGNHTSAGNRALEWNAAAGCYEGTVNLSMTGLWRINMKVYDKNGVQAGGSDVNGDGSSALFWDIEI